MQVLAVIRDSFQGMADGVAEIQNGPQPALGFILMNDFGLDFAAPGNDRRERFGLALEQRGHLALQPGKECLVIDNAVLDHLGEARAILARRQGRQRVQVAQHQLGLVESPDEVLARRQIDAHLAADRAVHLRQKRRRHLHEGNASQVGRGHKTRQIAHHTAAEGHDERPALKMLDHEFVVAELNGSQALGGFAGRHSDEDGLKASIGQSRVGGPGIEGSNVAVGNDGTAAAEAEAAAFVTQSAQEASADLDTVAAIAQRHGYVAHGEQNTVWPGGVKGFANHSFVMAPTNPI